MFDVYASEVQYLHHLAPVAFAGGGGVRVKTAELASLMASEGRAATVGPPVRPTLVASHSDLMVARRSGVPVAYMEHGCGQSYGGDSRSAAHPAYAGGGGREGCGLILAPNEFAAERWRARYPGVPVHVIGATRVLSPPGDPRRPLLAVSFHWEGPTPETRSALPHYARGLAALAEALPVVGHSHPRAERTARRVFGQAGIRYVSDVRTIASVATVYAVDNSSTLWELGLTRPVIALDAPWYRRHVEHGLRFWSHVPGPRVDDAVGLLREATRLLREGEPVAEYARRVRICGQVIPRLDGASAAATLVIEWARELT